jgi:cob(I)alamin adenosyltransferase
MLQFGTGSFVDMKNPSPQEISSAKSGLDKSREIIFSGLYEIVILDEITVAMNLNLISEEDVIGLMRDKPNDVELVMTGRGATKKMIETADLVTEMKEVKHYFKKGVKAREGIEF